MTRTSIDFGNGEDGDAVLTRDGNPATGTTSEMVGDVRYYTLMRDVRWRTLDIADGVVLNSDGYRVRVSGARRAEQRS